MTTKYYKLIPAKDLPVIAANPIKEITKDIKDLAINLCFTMRKNGGIGIAAPQVGILLRIVVINTCLYSSDTNNHGCCIMINPEIIEAHGEQEILEECLRFPSKKIKVKRNNSIRVKWKTIQNEFLETTFHGITAAAIQHEMDSLDGKTIYDEDGWKL